MQSQAIFLGYDTNAKLYILRGKCRYCKTKIAPKYFFIELLTGLTFVLFAYFLKLEIFNLYFICGLLYIAGLFVISGIDKEHHEVRLSVILYMTIVQAIYIIYLYYNRTI